MLGRPIPCVAAGLVRKLLFEGCGRIVVVTPRKVGARHLFEETVRQLEAIGERVKGDSNGKVER